MARGFADRRHTGWWIVAACVAVAGCVPSLAAVRTTAGLGMQLSAYEGAFDRTARYCHYTDFINTPDPQCVGLEKDLPNWHAVNRALVGYATALGAMADDASDRNQESHIATALGASVQLGEPFSGVIDASITSGVSRGVSTLIHGILGVYRRERLAATIRDSDEALQAIARGIEENTRLLDRANENLIAMIGDTMTSIQIGNSPAADRAGMTIALSLVRDELAAYRAHLATYRGAVVAFAKAHSHIRKKLNGLGDRKADLELLKLIAADVVAITKSVKTVINRPPP
jgi:hypothetical protein